LSFQYLPLARNILGPGEVARKIGREKVRRDVAQPATGLKGKLDSASSATNFR